MDMLDRKIKSVLSRKLEITEDYRDMVNAFINNLPDHKPRRKEKKIKSLPQAIAIGTLAISAVSVCAYTGGKIYEKFIKEQVTTEVKNNGDEVEYINLGDEKVKLYTSTINDVKWEEANSNEYLKITTIEEYNEYKNKLKDAFEFVEMTESDFEDEFLFIIKILENKSHINDIYADDETMHVEVLRDFELEEANKEGQIGNK